MNVVIFANTGPKVGLGHIYRCLPIAFFFKYYQWSVQLFTPKDVSNIENGWHQGLFGDIMPTIDQNSVVILDSYNNIEDWKQLIQQRPDLIFVRFDDREDSIDGEDLVVNSAPNARLEIYQSQALCGPNYSVIDSIFLDNRKTKINKDISSILVALGGSDINNQMEELLLHITKLFTGIIYVVGENTTCLKKSNIFTLGVISQRQLAKYMNKVDLGIFAGGTMIHQALCVGLPIIAFPQTKHQSKHVSLWKELNSVVPIYNLDQFEDAWYYSRCETNRKKLSSIGKQTIDGIGAKKVVREIIEIYCKNYSDCC